MKLSVARKYRHILRKSDSIFYRNPLLTLGLALPLVVIPSYGLMGACAVSLAMLICFIPSVVAASLIGNRLPVWLRVVFYPLLSCLLLIPAQSLVQYISPLIFDTLGVYFSLICVNSLLAYSVEKACRQKPLAAFAFAFRLWLGSSIVALLCGVLRELAASGSLWGVVIFKDLPHLPFAQMAMGGFILLGFLAAFFRLIHRLILLFTLKAADNPERGEEQK